ncbi:hypothetical protein, variant [Fonticula alba]|uniref:DNA-directed RNA polymerase I, II, and III subunit RPABC1 n=1 Tax=Fonticula alba TaxID=691883 RepID=A0A058ZFC6_FONAL|nr:hypothetical protein H696_00236 [Fonticula alba]XP_009492357.1 hypothetical protein, variant [Fonticula alba]KCV72655.1 hypothetical protein H696_00236 [Fonticula alba]KCV72656.1 hypothetical protein, variant [Fonticula alba]|eukprot:XP_009492356.1 hypothetical protein H696_00236 [Fonticula alba]
MSSTEWASMTSEQKEREFTRLWRVRRTVFQMLNDRGYSVTNADLNMTLDAFRKEHPRVDDFDRSSLNMIVKHQDKADTIVVFFVDRLRAETFKNFHEKVIINNTNRAIIVQRDSPTSPVLRQVEAEGDRYELFMEVDLVINIIQHKLVPEHKPLNEEEKRQLLSRYGLKQEQLPRIVRNDPVARYFGLRRGQVIKITRASETAGRYVTYRICF